MTGTRERLTRMLRRLPPAHRAVRSMLDVLDPDRREIAVLQRSGADVFQPFPTSYLNRHPKLFKALAGRLAELPEPEILSFGCAGGEEVRSLRMLLPHARITGIDTNRRVIAKALAADADPRSSYVVSDRPDPAERYDAVLALAVFRHGALRTGQPPESCAAYLPFARVDVGIARLDAVLRVGGWLALANSQFRFEETAVSRRYGPAEIHGTGGQPDPLYDARDCLVEITSRAPRLYRKLRD